jgi:hypothetical protein
MLHALLPLHRMVLVETLLLVRKLTIQQEQGKMQVAGNPKKTTKFKKKNMGKVNISCFVCGKEGHLAEVCRHCKSNSDGQQKKVVNMTIG